MRTPYTDRDITEGIGKASLWTLNQMMRYGWYGTTVEQKFVATVILANPSLRRWAFFATYEIMREAVMGQVRLAYYLSSVTYRELILRPLVARGWAKPPAGSAARPTLLERAAKSKAGKARAAAAAKPPPMGIAGRIGGGAFAVLAFGGGVIVNAWNTVEQTYLDPNTGDFNVA